MSAEPLTLAAAQAILRAPRFADPESIRARDLVAAVERAADELLNDRRECHKCKGTGEDRNCFEDPCEECGGMGGWRKDFRQTEPDDLIKLWRDLYPDARQEALRRARTNRAKVKA